MTLLGDLGAGLVIILAAMWFIFSWKFIVILIMLFSVAGSIISNLPKLRTLQHGVLTRGSFIRKEVTGKKVNKKPEYLVFFKYKTSENVLMESSLKTAKIGQVTDDEKEFLIYNKQKPEHIEALDILPRLVQNWIKNNF